MLFSTLRRAAATWADPVRNGRGHPVPFKVVLVHDRADEMPEPPGPGVFQVRVLARGVVAERIDAFLSPCSPVIED